MPEDMSVFTCLKHPRMAWALLLMHSWMSSSEGMRLTLAGGSNCTSTCGSRAAEPSIFTSTYDRGEGVVVRMFHVLSCFRIFLLVVLC